MQSKGNLFVQDANLDEPPTKKPTRLAIGMEGGFSGGVEKVRTCLCDCEKGLLLKSMLSLVLHFSVVMSNQCFS